MHIFARFKRWFLSPSYSGPRPLAHVVAASIGNSPVKPLRRIRTRSWPGTRLPWLSGWRGTLLLALVCCLELVPSASGQITLLNEAVKPSLVDSNDGKAVELGVKFRSDTSGSVTGLRFYKATTNTGTHVGHIWSSSGTLLASATFTSETGSGWQRVSFSTPVPIAANTVYIASYFAPTGHYSADSNYFAKAGVDRPPLHALANGVSGPNGVYLYSGSGGFPTSSYQSTNYWVDIEYAPSQQGAVNPQLSESASTLSFGSVTVNSSATQSLTLTSSGTSPVTVNSASISGAAFSLVGATLPATLNPGQSISLQVQFKPAATGLATGNLTISSNSTTGGTAVVSLSGTGTTANSQLTLSATTLSFGSVAINSSTTQSLTLTSSGTSPVTVNSASISGSGFTIVGGSFPITLNPNQSATVQVQFKPTAAGSVTGNLTISSNSTNGSTAVVSLSGTGTATPHEVDLSWAAPGSSPDPVAGYNIYRSTGGGSDQLINASILTQTSYIDSTVVSGTTYSYTVKSVDSNGVESVASNPITVTIP